MIRSDIIQEYTRLNGQDRNAFHRWLITNTVVGALALLGLIAVTTIFPGGDAGTVAAEHPSAGVHAQAR
jgi:hypothetical protein